MSSPRHLSESLEKLFGPESGSGLSRDDDNDFSFEGFPDPQTGSEVVPPSSGVPLRPSPSCVGGALSSGSRVLDVSHSPRCASLYEVPPASPQCLRSSAPRRGPRLLGRWLAAGIFGGGLKTPISWSAFPSAKTSPDLFLYSDASDKGWGAALGDLHLSGLWSPLCLELFNQSSRNFGNSLCGSGFSSLPLGSSCRSVLRQLYCPGLPPETRRHLFVHLERSCSGTPLALRGSFHSSSSPVHSRPSQCSGGLAQPSLSSPRLRVDVVSSGCGGASSPVTCHHRPLRDIPEPSPAGVLFTDVRSAVGSHMDAMLQSWDGLQA